MYSSEVIHSFFFCLDSLEVIRCINDQVCPYFKYCPIENRGNRIYDIVVDDIPSAQRTANNTGISSNYHGLFYEFKPYE